MTESANREQEGDAAREARPARPADTWQTLAHVEQWRDGDPDAFAMLHEHFAPLLRARVRRSRIWPMLEEQHQVDDVVQEIWVRGLPAVQKTFRHEGPGSFLAFLGKIADRTMIDLVRALRAGKRGNGQSTRALRTDWEPSAGLKPGQSALETPTSHARSSELLQIAEAELSEREREAWQMVELEGYSAEEAGLAMRCSGSAIRGLLLRSRARLVARLVERPRP
jgi:RNA polymerase sigma factor (sigma-70 family)